MKIQFYTLLIILIPLHGFSQTPFSSDSASNKLENDCHSNIFTKAEIPPSLKINVKKFEDSLSYFLKTMDAFEEQTSVTFKFILTKYKEILELKKLKGFINEEEAVKMFLISHPYWWKPARQNGREVCMYVYLKIEIDNNKLNAVLIERP